MGLHSTCCVWMLFIILAPSTVSANHRLLIHPQFERSQFERSHTDRSRSEQKADQHLRDPILASPRVFDGLSNIEADLLKRSSPPNQEFDTQMDSTSAWKTKWVLGLNGSQASYNNWSQGNTNSIAATGSNMFNATFKRSKYSYDILINLKYGKAKINGAEVRKTDDLIALKNRLDYMLHVKDVSAYFEADFRTQFDKGYDKNRVYISSFMAPATLLETAGLGYKPNKILQFQSGLTMKQTFMADTSLSRVYGLKTGSHFRNEGGVSLGAGLKMNVAKNLVLNSSAQSFTNILRPVDETDIIFSNELTGKINSFMNTNIQFVMVYDKDFNTSLQIKQVLAVGLSFTVL